MQLENTAVCGKAVCDNRGNQLWVYSLHTNSSSFWTYYDDTIYGITPYMEYMSGNSYIKQVDILISNNQHITPYTYNHYLMQ